MKFSVLFLCLLWSRRTYSQGACPNPDQCGLCPDDFIYPNINYTISQAEDESCTVVFQWDYPWQSPEPNPVMSFICQYLPEFINCNSGVQNVCGGCNYYEITGIDATRHPALTYTDTCSNLFQINLGLECPKPSTTVPPTTTTIPTTTAEPTTTVPPTTTTIPTTTVPPTTTTIPTTTVPPTTTAEPSTTVPPTTTTIPTTTVPPTTTTIPTTTVPPTTTAEPTTTVPPTTTTIPTTTAEHTTTTIPTTTGPPGTTAPPYYCPSPFTCNGCPLNYDEPNFSFDSDIYTPGYCDFSIFWDWKYNSDQVDNPSFDFVCIYGATGAYCPTPGQTICASCKNITFYQLDLGLDPYIDFVDSCTNELQYDLDRNCVPSLSTPFHKLF